MSNYAIGDVQGCYKEFNSLLEMIKFNPDQDKLWLCGDLVNRGPESLSCLKLIHSIRNSCYITLGNHDMHLIALAKKAVLPNKSDTLQEVLLDNDKDIYIDWLKRLPLIHTSKILIGNEEKRFVMTHAGIPPHWSLSEAINNSDEISSLLQCDKKCKNFLKAMYGDKPTEDNTNLTTKERLRLNTNYLTRMRFCDSRGRLELSKKGRPEDCPKGYKPWFNHELKIMKDSVHLLFGHWAALEGKTGIDNISALDTGCVWGNKLTAIRLEDSRVFSCNKLN